MLFGGDRNRKIPGSYLCILSIISVPLQNLTNKDLGSRNGSKATEYKDECFKYLEQDFQFANIYSY